MFLARLIALRNLWNTPAQALVEHREELATSLQITVHTLSDIGCTRESNEDCIASLKPPDKKLRERKGILVVLADGMGGRAAGEVASSLAVEVIRRTYYEEGESPAAALHQAFVQANTTIYQLAQMTNGLKGMGTTCTALVIRGNSAFCAHIGDSRLYLIRGNEIVPMTEDHTIVQEMVRAGLLSEKEASRHPEKNVLLYALGTRPQVDISLWTQPFPIQSGDAFLLCSDGLYDVVQNDEIKHIILTERDYDVCPRLIALAKSRGGHDNITVGLIVIQDAGHSSVVSARDTEEVV